MYCWPQSSSKLFSTGEENNHSEAEENKGISESHLKEAQFVVEGSEAKKKLIQQIEKQNEDAEHKKRVLPLLKPRPRRRHKERKNHGNEEQE